MRSEVNLLIQHIIVQDQDGQNYNKNEQLFPWFPYSAVTGIVWLVLQLNNGTLVGSGCDTPHYVPDVFLMSIILFLGTFILSVQLKDFKNALFFPSKVRKSV